MLSVKMAVQLVLLSITDENETKLKKMNIKSSASMNVKSRAHFQTNLLVIQVFFISVHFNTIDKICFLFSER